MSGIGRAAAAAVVVTVLSGWVAAADAAAQLRGELTGDPTVCLDRAALEARVAGYLARPALGHPPDVTIELEEHLAPPRVTLVLTMRGPDGAVHGRRTLTGRASACPTLTAEAALVLALLLELEHTDVAIHAENDPSPDAPPPVSRPRPVTPPPAGGAHVELHVLGGVTVGVLPGASGLLHVAGALALRDGPRFTVFVEATADGGSGSAPRLDGLVATAGLTACAPLVPGRARLELCGGAALGVLQGWPQGLPETVASTRVDADLRLLAAFEWSLVTGVALRVEAGVLAPVTRDRYYYVASDGSDATLHAVAAFAPYLAAGVDLGAP